MNFDEKLKVDSAAYGHHIVKNIAPQTFKERVWCAWKILWGEAGIAIVRVSPEDFTLTQPIQEIK